MREAASAEHIGERGSLARQETNTMHDPFLPWDFQANGDDGGIYYCIQRDDTNTLWWYGEHPDDRWAHVYRGEITVERGAARWSGTFIDVPKGVSCGFGRLDWEREFVGPGTPALLRTRREGARNHFGGSLLAPTREPTSSTIQRLMPGFVGDGLENLTGVWIGDDGGTYYIRQVAETGEVAWVGEHPEARSRLLPTGQRWVNVFMGHRDGNLIRGQWTDVPKGQVDNHGAMAIMATSPRTLTIVAKTGGFGGSSFVRAENLVATLRWVSLTVLDQQEFVFEADEPYFYALIALMDGVTVDLTAPGSATVNTSQSFIAPKLRDNVGQGDPPIDLTSLRAISLPIRPVPGDGPDRTHPVLGIALRGAEMDFSTDGWRRDRLSDWVTAAGGNLEYKLRHERPITFATDVNRYFTAAGDSLPHDDDIFGFSATSFSYAQLAAMAGSTTTLTFNLRGSDVRYRVTAELSVAGVRGTCMP